MNESFPRTVKRLKRIQRRKEIGRHDAVRSAIEQIYLGGIRKSLAHAQVQVLHRLHRGAGKAGFANSARGQFANSGSATGRPVAMDFMFDLDSFTEMFFAEMREAGTEALEISGQGLLSELGIDRKYVTPHGLIHDFTIERENRLSQVGPEIYEDIKSTLEEGVQNGETMDELAARVQKEFKGIDAGRAHTIAQTETASAYNTGRMDGMKRHGITHKFWLTADDERVRTSHEECEAQGPIPIDDRFKNGLPYPCAPRGPAAEVINCRCTLEAAEAPKRGKHEFILPR